MTAGVRCRPGALLLPLLLCLPAPPAAAKAPRIAIIIDDLGHGVNQGLRVAALPGPVACAVLPDSPHGPAVAGACHAAGKTVMLHLPMEAEGDGAAQEATSLGLGMGRQALQRHIQAQLGTVPFATGVNNHMGSRLTRNLAYMHWVMVALRERALFFIDSRTTAASVAQRVAMASGVAAARRDVFLDNERSEAAIERQLDILAATARRQGAAVAIGHPYPETLAVLERRLPGFAAAGIMLVSPADVVGAPPAEHQSWRAYSSP